MVIEIILRNWYTIVYFYQVRLVLFPTTFWGVICAECMNIIEMDILSLLDNAHYFFLYITVILP